jgi:AcrR family transcriptional regulator
MTRDDVITAAFRVWGKEFYKTTSLAGLAEALQVSKPALYRHFTCKLALQKAMEERFYNDYIAALKPFMEETRKQSHWRDKLLVMIRFISGYFARNSDYLVYTLVRLHSAKQQRFLDPKIITKWGVDFASSDFCGQEDHQYPSVLFLAGFTAFCGTAIFHKNHYESGGKPLDMKHYPFTALPWKEPTEEEIQLFTQSTVERVKSGLHFDPSRIEAIPWKKLEALNLVPQTPPDPLLKAVAEAVAEKGVWKASMETVAKRSGLSKSGLYAHFKSKEDMLSRLFMSEFDRVSETVTASIALSQVREEQLYLAILSLASYLKARPEIMVAMDWVRIQNLELDIQLPAALHDFFGGIKPPHPYGGVWDDAPFWIPFLLISMMQLRRRPIPEADKKSLRKLFKYVCLGVEGLVYSTKPRSGAANDSLRGSPLD